MEALFIAVAFFFGLFAQQLGLPPLVGYLISGFVLRALGQQGGEALETISNLGITLMLFTIGLKLQLRGLLRSEIWAGTILHICGTVFVFGVIFLSFSAIGVFLFASLTIGASLLLALALSFSSTVFAVKALQESGETGALHGRVAVGILIMQDLIAVMFLTASTGKLPSWISIGLLVGLLALRPAMEWLMARSGHGELVTLCGLLLALVLGWTAFEFVGLKGDLGALFLGVLVGQHPKSKELAKSLIGLTDLFLVGFFLSIGLRELPNWEEVAIACLLLMLMPFKVALFFALLTRFHLRARTAWMAALRLGSYSEFALIVIALAATKGWIPHDWLVLEAIALALSFLVAAPLNRRAESLYDKLSSWLQKFETPGYHPDDLPLHLAGERIAIFGMGRVGLAAYKLLEDRFPERVIGFDRDAAQVEFHRKADRNVVLADATDSDFWERVQLKEGLDLVILTMPKHTANLHAAQTLRRHGYQGIVAAIANFDDEVRELRALGVDTAFNLYSEAGAGFADHVCDVFSQGRPDVIRS
jgi:glutathione-regulated potassium-efflux system ancillary protein KefC